MHLDVHLGGASEQFARELAEVRSLPDGSQVFLGVWLAVVVGGATSARIMHPDTRGVTTSDVSS